MNCPRCGEICRCRPEALQAVSETQFVDPEAPDLSEQEFEESLGRSGEDGPQASVCTPAPAGPSGTPAASWDTEAPLTTPPGDGFPDAAESSWRNEIPARLDRYRTRRNIRPPRYASFSLQFHEREPAGRAGADAASPPAFEPVSEHALALNGMIAGFPAADMGADPKVQPAQELCADVAPQSGTAPSAYSGGKILEFPRFAWGPPAPPPDQLAEPVITRPRILEVPETAPPPPALGGITMEVSEREEPGKQRGIDTPLVGIAVARRILAAGIDGLIVVIATALFGAIFWKVAAVRPPMVHMLVLAGGIPCLFWAAYQYLLIVYNGSTPGLRAAGLKLVRFDGTSTTRSLRRWRVLASYLSGASLGMGFAWLMLDEDALCWHDRITHTCFAPKRQSAGGTLSPRP